jgi:hypothetical protein
MNCANPECRCGLFDLPGGSIWLMQLEVPRDHLAEDEDCAFSVCVLPRKYFWLGADCSQFFVISHWTPSGLSLAKRQTGVQRAASRQAEDASDPFPICVCASNQVEEEFLDVG